MRFLMLIPIFIVLALISCQKEEEIKQETKFDVKQSENVEFNLSDSQLAAQEPAQPVKFKKLVSPEELATTLPKQIIGFETYPASFGASYDEDNSWTTASVDYYDKKNKSSYNISIFDYGSRSSINDLNIIEKPLPEPGISLIKITGKDYHGYLFWNESTKSGNVYVLAYERFVLKMNIIKLHPNAVKAQDLVTSYDFGKLKEIYNKNSNE